MKSLPGGLNGSAESLGLVSALAICVAFVSAAASAEPVDPAPTKTPLFHWSGKVVDSAGNAVAEAAVEAYQSAAPGPFFTGDIDFKQRTNTGPAGLFDFQLPGVSTIILALKPGLAPAWIQQWKFNEDTKNQTLVLTSPTTASGRVVDDQGRPVAGAEVYVTQGYQERPTDQGGLSYNYLPPVIGRRLFSGKTGAGGQFQIQGLPTGCSADLAVISLGKVLRLPSREYTGPDTMICRSGDTDIKLVLDPAGSIMGKIIAGETREPIAGARFQLVPTGRSINRGASRDWPPSSETGEFKLTDLAAGTYDLISTIGTNAVPDWVAARVPVTVEAGKTTDKIEIVASRGGILEVGLKGHEPAASPAEARVNIYGSKYQANRTPGTNQLVTFRLPQGEYQVSAFQGNRRSQALQVQIENAKTNRIDLELPEAPLISGVVRDPSGAPAANLPLTIFPEYRGDIGEVKTDAEGRFSFEYDYQRYAGSREAICLLARDPARNLAGVVDLDQGTTNLDIKLEKGLTMSGRVENTSGGPLTNATIQVHMWSGNTGSQLDRKPVRTDAKGEFKVQALPAGRRYTTYATAPGYGSASTDLSDEPEETNVRLPAYVLHVADRKLGGKVLDADDNPVQRASVHIYGQGQPSVSTRTDGKGEFFFAGVCEGPLQVSASYQSAYGNTRAEGGDTNVLVRLRASGGYARSEVRPRASLRGQPLPDLGKLQVDSASLPTGKSLLVCLFDLEQRPSRRFIKLIAEQHKDLLEKGVAVVGLQAAVLSAETFAEWKNANSVPFPVGRVVEKEEQTRWASEVESLPCLILTDSDHRVTDEYFSLEDLEARLKSLK